MNVCHFLQRLNESETSSEPEFRKKLPPVALTPSKHARLFYGVNYSSIVLISPLELIINDYVMEQGSEKEDLVTGGSGGNAVSGGNAGNGANGAATSPWEYPRSRLRLQTLIGEGNFGQVWKAEADDICGCQVKFAVFGNHGNGGNQAARLPWPPLTPLY